ncbi:MAG: Universal stress protein [Syntrophorhabdus sp. PtaU1.Bin058]|nr:MAG: Universal stress protein [Syntrophorhabdus sp. PtaU1.Bin058]
MKILVGYGGQDDEKVLDEGIKHAKAFGGAIFVVTVMETVSENQVPEVEKAQAELKRVKERVEQKNIHCETRLLERGVSPGEDLVKFAEEEGIDMILVGIQRTSRVGKILFGSNAQYVILNSPCPVVTVK